MVDSFSLPQIVKSQPLTAFVRPNNTLMHGTVTFLVFRMEETASPLHSTGVT